MIQNHCVYFDGLCLFPSWQSTEEGVEVFLEAAESDVWTKLNSFSHTRTKNKILSMKLDPANGNHLRAKKKFYHLKTVVLDLFLSNYVLLIYLQYIYMCVCIYTYFCISRHLTIKYCKRDHFTL